MFYLNPPNLPDEVSAFEREIAGFRAGDLTDEELKARRVPFGCYEQRRDAMFMLRVRTTGGAITPVQLRRLAQVARQYRSPFLHITTRQEFQLHDLALDDVTAAMRELLTVGLSTRGGGGNTVRNITLSPEAGVSADEAFDPSPYAFALTTRLIAEADSLTLPRKLKIAFSASDADTGFARFNDLGFIARVRDGQRGFRVFVAGGMGAKPQIGHSLHDFIAVDEVYAVAEAVKRLFDKRGNRRNRHTARIRFLWNKLGAEDFVRFYEEERALLRAEAPPSLDVSPFDDLCAIPSLSSGTRVPKPRNAAFRAWRSRFVESQPQKGLFSVLLPITLGNLDTAFVITLADFLEEIGPNTIRAGYGQNLRLRNIPEDRLSALWTLVKDADGLIAQPRVLGAASACTGADTCKLGICQPKRALLEINRRLAASGLALDSIPSFRLNLSGCPNSCGQHMLADLGFSGGSGKADGRNYPVYAVVAGGIVSADEARFAKALGKIPARALPAFVADVVARWLEAKEGYASFALWIDTDGADVLKALIAHHGAVPSYEDNPAFYRDWGQAIDFSTAERSAGECAIDLFSMIVKDIQEARRLQEEIAQGRDETALYAELALRTARPLLITKGSEAKTEKDVFEAFNTHFIDSGLVAPAFRAVIEAAATGDYSRLRTLKDDLLALLDQVESLYQGLDGSLRFTAVPA